METPDIQSWFRNTLARIKSLGRSTKRSPEFVWKTLLTFFVAGMLGALGGEYLIIYGSEHAPIDSTVNTPQRDILNIPELKGVLVEYQEKKDRLNALVANMPEFPSPERGIVLKLSTEKVATSSTARVSEEPVP